MSRLVIVLLLLAVVSRLHAQDDELASVATVRVVSRCLFRGVVESGSGAEGNIQIARDGWRIGAEIAQPFDQDEPVQGNLTAAYAWKATEPLQLGVSATQRWRSDGLPGMARNSFEGGLSATWTLANDFTAELAGFHDVQLRANTLQVTLNYSMPLKSLGAYLEWSASIGTSSARDLRPDAVGAAIRDAYSYYTASVRLPYRIGSRTTLITGAHIAETDGQSRSWSPIAARGGLHGWIDVGLSVDF